MYVSVFNVCVSVNHLLPVIVIDFIDFDRINQSAKLVVVEFRRKACLFWKGIKCNLIGEVVGVYENVGMKTWLR